MSASAAPETTGPAALVVAEDLSLTARRHTVWSGLDFAFGPGLGAVTGLTGSGKSTLLLALTGRMSGVRGGLAVDGIDAVADARRVRAVTSVARIDTMIDLEGRLTVGESVTERALIERVPTAEAAARMAALAAQLDLPDDPDRLVDDLDALDRTVFAVALARLRPAVVTVLDDADRGLTVAEQHRLYDALETLAGDHTAIVVSTREPAALPRRTPVVDLSAALGPDPAPDPEPIPASDAEHDVHPSTEPRRSR